MPALTILPVPVGKLTVVSSNSSIVNDDALTPNTRSFFLKAKEAVLILEPAIQSWLDTEKEISDILESLEILLLKLFESNEEVE